MSIEIDETMQIYIDESLEHLADIENDFLAIEEGGADIDENLVNKVYRAAHSIKGGAGFMGLTNIKNLTHEMENILGKIRSNELAPNSEIINILLLASDILRNLINDVVNSNDQDISEHVDALKAIDEGPGTVEIPTPPKVAKTNPNIEEKVTSVDSSETIKVCIPRTDLTIPVPVSGIETAWKEIKYIYLVNLDIVEDIQKKEKDFGTVISDMQQTGSILGSNPKIEEGKIPDESTFSVIFATILNPGDINILFNIQESQIFEYTRDGNLMPIGDDPPAEPAIAEKSNPVKPVVMDPPEAPVEESNTKKKAASSVKATPKETNLRVNIALLDSLMNLAGELVLGRNQLVQAVASNDFNTTQTTAQRLDLITSELQEAIMLTRMQSIGNVFNKFSL
jgi:two-component system, chemotaxis family, sensor kinase CheA